MVEAAGAVLWRPGPEVALIHRPRYDDWTFPKGKAEPGERPPLTAVREVEEETGIRPVLGRRLRTTEYVSGGVPKRVVYWSATGRDAPFTPGDEVDRLDWLPLPEAAERLTYPRDAAVLREFARGPLDTRPQVIVRHTSAGRKRERDDDLRPLDERGRVEAIRLGALLACFGPAQVVSSPTARCLETMLPYAAGVGVELRTERAFLNGPGAGARLAELLDTSAPAVVCTHGELVPGLVTGACEHLGAEPPADLALPKGGCWILQVAAGALASIERHDLIG